MPVCTTLVFVHGHFLSASSSVCNKKAMHCALALRLSPLPILAPGPDPGAKVDRIEPGVEGGAVRVVLSDGRSVVACRGVVVATEGPEAARLLGDKLKVGGLVEGGREKGQLV